VKIGKITTVKYNLYSDNLRKVWRYQTSKEVFRGSKQKKDRQYKSMRRGTQLVPIGMPTICWKNQSRKSKKDKGIQWPKKEQEDKQWSTEYYTEN